MIAKYDISVIVPAYNAEEFIEKCLVSIVSQSYSNYELILIDDGSTDHTLEIMSEFASQDSRIKVFHQTNHGIAASRQFGIKISTGKYIAFVDSDDQIAIDYLQTLFEIASNENADIVMSSHQKTDRFDGSIYNHRDKSIVFYSNEDCMKAFLKFDSKVQHVLWSKLISRDLFRANDFPEGRIFEDTAVVYKLISRSVKTVYIEYDGYLYYQHSKSVMHHYNVRESLDRVKTYCELSEFISQYYPNLLSNAIDLLYGGANSSMMMMKTSHEYNSEYVNEIQQMLKPFNKGLSSKRKIQRFLILYFPIAYKFTL